MQAYSLSFKEADALTQDAPTGDLLDAAVRDGADPKRCANLLLGRGAAIANERACTIAETGVTAVQLAELAKMLAAGTINATSAAKVFDAMLESGTSPAKIAESQGLLATTDASEIESWVDAAIAANPGPAEQVRTGDKKAKQAFGFLMGAVMKASGGKAPPAKAKELLEQKLSPK
jgi:aspartyl-tRNA(Asn)/glutamyl-tRNA(Gln) amidotransferase subunit B